MKDKSKRKFISVQSKVSARTAERLSAIVEKYGFKSNYELMQYILSAFLRYVDAEHEEAEEESKNLAFVECGKMFAGWMEAQSRIITTAPAGSEHLDLVKSVFIYHKTGKKGYVVKEVSGAENRIFVNYSVDHALSSVLKLLHPETYAKVKAVGDSMGVKNIRVVIDTLLQENGASGPKNAINEDFERFANNPDYGNKPKQKRNRKNMETV